MEERKLRNWDRQLRMLLRHALDQCPVKRPEVCDRLTEAVGRKISESTLDAWCADTKTRWHLPADVVPALAEITGDDGIARKLLCERALLRLKTGEFVWSHPSILEKFEKELMNVVFTELYGKRGLAYAKKAQKLFKRP